MGSNKLVETVRGKPLVRQCVDAALASRLDPVLVVTGHEAEKIQAALRGSAAAFVHNPDYRTGLSSSLRAGIAAVPSDCDGAMILLGDMPGISPSLIDGLVSAFDPLHGRSICVACAGGRQGHPVLWSRVYFDQIAGLSGDAGARKLVEAHAGRVIEVQAEDNAPLIDIDTKEALAAYRE
jgi:molybdenum cofactor cytidylyltransferase